MCRGKRRVSKSGEMVFLRAVVWTIVSYSNFIHPQMLPETRHEPWPQRLRPRRRNLLTPFSVRQCMRWSKWKEEEKNWKTGTPTLTSGPKKSIINPALPALDTERIQKNFSPAPPQLRSIEKAGFALKISSHHLRSDLCIHFHYKPSFLWARSDRITAPSTRLWGGFSSSDDNDLDKC